QVEGVVVPAARILAVVSPGMELRQGQGQALPVVALAVGVHEGPPGWSRGWVAALPYAAGAKVVKGLALTAAPGLCDFSVSRSAPNKEPSPWTACACRWYCPRTTRRPACGRPSPRPTRLWAGFASTMRSSSSTTAAATARRPLP